MGSRLVSLLTDLSQLVLSRWATDLHHGLLPLPSVERKWKPCWRYELKSNKTTTIKSKSYTKRWYRSVMSRFICSLFGESAGGISVCLGGSSRKCNPLGVCVGFMRKIGGSWCTSFENWSVGIVVAVRSEGMNNTKQAKLDDILVLLLVNTSFVGTFLWFCDLIDLFLSCWHHRLQSRCTHTARVPQTQSDNRSEHQHFG